MLEVDNFTQNIIEKFPVFIYKTAFFWRWLLLCVLLFYSITQIEAKTDNSKPSQQAESSRFLEL